MKALYLLKQRVLRAHQHLAANYLMMRGNCDMIIRLL